MKSLLFTAVAALAMVVGLSGTASAHGCYGGGYNGGYSTPSYPTFHNTSHWDYSPGYYQPHGNHAHYVPGQYTFHQTGHYHY